MKTKRKTEKEKVFFFFFFSIREGRIIAFIIGGKYFFDKQINFCVLK